MEERKDYEVYDKEHREREKIVAKLSKKHPDLDFVIGGAVSMDIFNKGNDKGQVMRHFKDKPQDCGIVFVGDRIAFPGNDYSLAEEVKRHPNGEAVEVHSWQDTAALLKDHFLPAVGYKEDYLLYEVNKWLFLPTTGSNMKMC